MYIDIELATLMFAVTTMYLMVYVLGLKKKEQDQIIWEWPKKKEYHCIDCNKELESKDEIPYNGDTIAICDICLDNRRVGVRGIQPRSNRP